jgi:hypothetical protein
MYFKKALAVILAALILVSINPYVSITEAKVKHSKRIHHSKKVNRLSNNRYYTNVSGHRVHSPAFSNSVPAGASAECRDGSYSFSENRRGTCSHHGGVKKWLH